jgi:hypothetical protein
MLTVAQAEELCKASKGTLISERTARAHTNRFILETLRDGFCAGQPRLVILVEEPIWSVPILLSRPDRVLGEVGEVLLHGVEGYVLGFTPPMEIYRYAARLES